MTVKNKNNNEIIQSTRSFTLKREANNNGLISVVFATETPVKRHYFGRYDEVFEKLIVDNDAVDLSRLNAGASVCNAHDTYRLEDVLGVVVKGSARINNNNECVCDIKLSEREEVAGIVKDIRDGIINNVSVGYRIDNYSVEGENDDVPTVAVDRWTPHEISFVPVPADANSVVTKRNMDKDKKNNNKEAEQEKTNEVKTEFKQERAAPNNSMEIKKQIAEAVTAERKRNAEITRRCRAASIPEEKEQELLSSNRSMADIANDIIDYYEAVNFQETQRAKTSVTSTSGSTKEHSEMLRNALCSRARCEKLKDGNSFARHSLLDVAREIVSKGRNTNGMATTDLVRAALTTSDFPKLLMDVANKSLQKAYEETPQTFRPLVRETSAADFKAMHRVKLGDAPDLEKVKENGEYEHGSIGEEAESYKIDTYGKIINLSRQAIINDDLDGFTRIPQLFGVSAARRESDLFWSLLKSNPLMSDKKGIFHVDHNNLNATAGKFEIATFSAIRAAMKKQKTIDGKLMSLSPTYLVVPVDYETLAEQFLSTNMLATQIEDINPFQGRFQIIAEPRLDSEQFFYMFCNNSLIDTFEIAYLNGNRGVYLDQQETFSTDGVQFKARLDVGFGAIDYRGVYKQAVKK